MSASIRAIFTKLDQHIPEAATELEYDGTPYTLLVCVLLSARSTDLQVNRATPSLFKVAKTPEEMVKLGYHTLCTYINSIGLYKTKAKNLIELSNILISKYSSKVPEDENELMSLPGIGIKSAKVLVNILHAKPTIAVDTHVFRVATRLNLGQSKTREKMSLELEEVLSKELEHDLLMKAHHLMVLHGRYTCKAIKPNCSTCPIRHLCKWPDKSKFS